MKMFPPMLAARSAGRGGRPSHSFEWYMKTGSYVADTKLDGVRALARWNDGAVQLWNRARVDITYRYPDVVHQLTPVLRGKVGLTLDGEIVAKDGRFESTLIRDQQSNVASAVQAATQYPATYIAFDHLLCHPATGDVVDTREWLDRRNALEILHNRHLSDLSITVVSLNDDFLERTRELGMEGVVIKHKHAKYIPDSRGQQWIKFRNLYRVTCLVAGYTPGQGQRAEFGAMELALIDDNGQAVSVGRCGTGFAGADIPNLKAALDRDELLIVEIEATNQTKNHTLRFPVFKGVRTDVPFTDCTLKQLTGLPTC